MEVDITEFKVYVHDMLIGPCPRSSVLSSWTTLLVVHAPLLFLVTILQSRIHTWHVHRVVSYLPGLFPIFRTLVAPYLALICRCCYVIYVLSWFPTLKTTSSGLNNAAHIPIGKDCLKLTLNLKESSGRTFVSILKVFEDFFGSAASVSPTSCSRSSIS